jgi:hypothetical protein
LRGAQFGERDRMNARFAGKLHDTLLFVFV